MDLFTIYTSYYSTAKGGLDLLKSILTRYSNLFLLLSRKNVKNSNHPQTTNYCNVRYRIIQNKDQTKLNMIKREI